MVEIVAGHGRLPAEWIVEMAGRTDGVPLFVEELTRAVIESGDPREPGKPGPRFRPPSTIPSRPASTGSVRPRRSSSSRPYSAGPSPMHCSPPSHRCRPTRWSAPRWISWSPG